jgi:hypothetical protein
VDPGGAHIDIQPDAATLSNVPPGALLPDSDARREGPTFEEWLVSEDAAVLAI